MLQAVRVTFQKRRKCLNWDRTQSPSAHILIVVDEYRSFLQTIVRSIAVIMNRVNQTNWIFLFYFLNIIELSSLSIFNFSNLILFHMKGKMEGKRQYSPSFVMSQIESNSISEN